MNKVSNYPLLAALSTLEIASVLGLWTIPANAFDFQLQSSQGTWIEVDEGRNAGNTNITGLGTNEIFWGNDLGDGQSGLIFEGVESIDFEYNEVFSLGNLTHINQTIARGSSIVGADLEITLDFALPDTQEILDFSFGITETQNDADVCLFGGPNPCRDRIAIQETGQVFGIGENNYQLTVLGWLNGNGEYTNALFTDEAGNTSASLYAVINQLDDTKIPEPLATGGLGLIGLYFAYHKRHQKQNNFPKK